MASAGRIHANDGSDCSAAGLLESALLAGRTCFVNTCFAAQVHPPTGKLLVLCCGRAKETLPYSDKLIIQPGNPRPRRLDEPWQDTLRCVDPVTGARPAPLCRPAMLLTRKPVVAGELWTGLAGTRCLPLKPL